MDNLAFSFWSVLVMLLPMLLHAVISMLIGAAGIVAIHRHCVASGIALLLSALFSLFNIGATFGLRQFFPVAAMADFAFAMSAAGLLSGGLLAGGVMGLARSIPADRHRDADPDHP
jgi:hypothetical protein